MRKKWKAVLSAALVAVACLSLFSACNHEREKQNSFTLQDLPEGVSFAGANKYVASVDLHDEDAVGSEYWKVRVCSEEERAKGNVFETDYFFFGEPKDENGRYALKIKEETELPENLYLGWLFCASSGEEAPFNFDPGYYVPEGTFAGRTEIKVVTIPHHAATTSEKMFTNCINLHTAYFRSWENWWRERAQTVPDGVTGGAAISAEMFANCVGLKEVIFSSVSYESGGGVGVYEKAFLNCVSLQKISFPGFLKYAKEQNQSWNKTTVVVLGEDAFQNCVAFGPADENQEITVRE